MTAPESPVTTLRLARVYLGEHEGERAGGGA